jgi:hypothetical protein
MRNTDSDHDSKVTLEQAKLAEEISMLPRIKLHAEAKSVPPEPLISA